MRLILGSVAIVAIVVSSGCVSVPVTPARLQQKASTNSTAKSEWETWKSSVDLANLFLKSECRKTLPEGVITFDDEGMIFANTVTREPVRVRCTTFGDLLVKCNMIAQERCWGFVVGKVGEGNDRLTDNSLFRSPKGMPLANIEIAATILHELTHLHLKMGIDNPVNFIRYYSEAIFLFRYRTHSMERLPYNTTREFYAFIEGLRKAHPDQFYKMPESN